MPNWCNNTLNIYNSDKSKLDNLEEELKKEKAAEILQYLRPGPKEWDYMWSVENWGTKWEARVYDYYRDEDGENITIRFDTAWGPPIALYEYLYELDDGWSIEAFYNEEGLCFAGMWDNGSHDYYEYGNLSADEIEEQLPHELNEMYGISEWKREWEEENEDEEEN